ncbi:uncharacterized protein LOC108142799 isoform X2 [Drosophila elegans]|uniref:uncharacterized protein LOC108142799 isoform X2 n=1 Tax=Drosophila elegans TaxID=30023 RepID=UPI0007E8A281|nr:uncharacterized protein LOC108142799 isoform X2 [Drosophila elegans]
MNSIKRRSSLRKAPLKEDDPTITTSVTKQQIKRRISFSGKKFVREFVNTKETNNWADSYEVSEHNAEDSSGSRAGSLDSGSVSKSGSLSKPPEDADKENVPLREEVDVSLNFQTSVDVTMLPCELMQNTQKTPTTTTTTAMVSISLSSEERKVFQSSLYDQRLMDKTMDLMSGSLVTRNQRPLADIENPSIELPAVERVKSVNAPAAKGVGDSFMDITPLGFRASPPTAPTAPPAQVPPSSAPVPTSAAPYPPSQHSSMELEDDSMEREMREFNEKEKKTPAQKSLFMDLEEAGKENKNKTQHEVVDLSFDCPLNVSEDRNHVPSTSFESNSSTISYMKDESVLIPFDMISGKNISKKINFRQLNDELEAGKIQLFPNGPKTPTTDRRNKQKRFWHGLEWEAMEDESPKKDIRSIKPRGTLNFSENMTMSPAPTSPVRKEKETLKVVDDKRKYRLSQADELMLDNTNFLAHARLGDETQSRNTSKNSTRRETTYDHSELSLEYPTSSQDFHSTAAKKLQQEPVAFSDIPGVKAVPTRRTLHLNESMDQEATKSMPFRKEIAVTTEEIVYEKSTSNEQQSKVWACTKTKRRETILMQESMEEGIISPLKDLHLKPTADRVGKSQSNVNQTLRSAEPVEEQEVSYGNVVPKEKSKARPTLLLAEPMEEELEDQPIEAEANDQITMTDTTEPKNKPIIRHSTIDRSTVPQRQKTWPTLLMSEPIEETFVEQQSMDQFQEKSRLKLRNTLMHKTICEDVAIGSEENPSKEHIFKKRQTLIMSEHIEEDDGQPLNIQNNNHFKSRNTLLMHEPISEDLTAGKEDNSSGHHKYKPRPTLIMSEPIEEDDGQPFNMQTNECQEKSSLKLKNTLLMHETVPEDLATPRKEDNSSEQHKYKPRQTLIMAEPIEEHVAPLSNTTHSTSSKSRHTLLMSEPIDEDVCELPPLGQNEVQFNEKSTKDATTNKSIKSRQTLLMSEAIEEEGHTSKAFKNDQSYFKPTQTDFMEESIQEVAVANVGQPSKSRQTLLMAEPIEEDAEMAYHNDQPKKRIEFRDESFQQTTIKNRSQSLKSRQTLLMAEPIEEDAEVCKSMAYNNDQSRKRIDFMEESIGQPAIKNKSQPSKSRQTLLLAEPIEEDAEIFNEPTDQPKQHPRLQLRNTHNSADPLRLKARHTLIMAEPIEEVTNVFTDLKSNLNSEADLETKKVSHSSGATTSKSRHTLLLQEPIEENDVTCRHHGESHEVDVAPSPAVNYTNKSRKTMILSQTIDEDVGFNGTEISRKPRATLASAQPIEDDLPLEEDQQIRIPAPSASSFKRHTLLLSEPMEEDEEVPGLSKPIPVEVENEKVEKPKGILRALKDYVFGKEKKEDEIAPNSRTHQTMVMSESMDFQSPENTMKDVDFNAITPLPNIKLASRIKQMSTYTPGMSLTEFELQEKMCKTPTQEKKRVTTQQKKLSIYQPMKMELDADASECGTPLNHTQSLMKRFPSHLTPNLPESKKRHTNLFVVSNMDMEMEMEEEQQEDAWRMTNIKSETGADKSRRTFTKTLLDASVQAVRAYHPAMAELNKKSSLDMLELPRKSVFDTELEDKAITISDVTNYFQEQRKSNERKSSSSDDPNFKSLAATNTKFINLTGDTTVFAGMQDLEDEEEAAEEPNQIDNERLSLVSTLAEETDEEIEEADPEESQPKPELCEGQLNTVVIAGSSGSCKKCGNCNQSLSETKFMADSFALPHQTLWEFSRERKRLRLLREKPTLKDVTRYWEIEEQARLSGYSDDSVDQTRVEEEPITWNKAELLEQIKRKINVKQKAATKPVESFFENLKRLLAEQQPNWIFDCQRKISQQLIFYHRLLTTFRIVVNYKLLDVVDESAIEVTSIEVDNAVATPKERWSAHDYFLDFQLSLKLPLNLTDAIDGNDEAAFLKFLHRIDQSIVEINQTFHNLLTVLSEKRARLLREANRTVVRKTVRKCIEDDPVVRLEKTSFLVEITNIKEVSFRDILRPELHLFNENIQYLPKGIAFLEAFLTDPEQYLKT